MRSTYPAGARCPAGGRAAPAGHRAPERARGHRGRRTMKGERAAARAGQRGRLLAGLHRAGLHFHKRAARWAPPGRRSVPLADALHLRAIEQGHRSGATMVTSTTCGSSGRTGAAPAGGPRRHVGRAPLEGLGPPHVRAFAPCVYPGQKIASFVAGHRASRAPGRRTMQGERRAARALAPFKSPAAHRGW